MVWKFQPEEATCAPRERREHMSRTLITGWEENRAWQKEEVSDKGVGRGSKCWEAKI